VSAPDAGRAREVVVRLDGVCVELDGRLVLEDVGFALRAGEFLGVVGPNGAGKTTLLKAILGLVPISRGRIEVFGAPLGTDRRLAEHIGYVPQRYQIPPGFPATVEDVVAMGRLSAPGRVRRARAEGDGVAESLALVGISALAERPVGRLSGGEQRRVMLAQALCASTRLLILDEPTIGLDLPAEHDFYALLRRLQGELALSVIAVSHDLVALAGAADSLVCINRRMHVHGNPEEVVHSHAIREAYSCEFDFLAGEIAHHERAAHGGAGETGAGRPGSE
jgi:zinc transport system ATP-binding protein